VNPRRHAIIPDAQLRPGDDLTHIRWAAEALVEYRPDAIIVMGDWWDLPSLSMHDAPGSKEAEGRNVMSDIQIGNEAFELLTGPLRKEQERLKRNRDKGWYPECHFLFGNHEDRLTRAISLDPKFDGLLTLDSLKTPGFQRHPYLKIVTIDGIKYCHFFPSPFSGKPIGGTIINRLGHIGSSFVQGHQQGFAYASKAYPDHVKHGIVCGRFYTHNESYRSIDVQNSEWNGIIILNQVCNGDFDIMPLRYKYLKSKYG
jgi:hypothetical protein